jgi:hypothetical protein
MKLMLTSLLCLIIEATIGVASPAMFLGVLANIMIKIFLLLLEIM